MRTKDQQCKKIVNTDADSELAPASPGTNPSEICYNLRNLKLQNLNNLHGIADSYQRTLQFANISEAPCQSLYEQDDDGDTQLHIAIISNDFDGAFWLINSIPELSFLEIVNDDGLSALHLAVMSRQFRIVRRLVLAGVALNKGTRTGNTALHIACNLGDLSCVKALTEPVADVETKRLRGFATQLVSSVRCDLEIKNYAGLTCLHIAASNGDIDIVRYLVNLGVNVDAPEGLTGKTALHLAIENNCRKVVYYLVESHQACLETVTFRGTTPYQIAVSCHSQLASELVLLGASPELPNSDSDNCSDTSSDDDDDNDGYIHQPFFNSEKNVTVIYR